MDVKETIFFIITFTICFIYIKCLRLLFKLIASMFE